MDGRPIKKGITRRQLVKAGLGAAALAAIPVLGEAEALNVEHHQLALPNWTAGRVRLAVISDFHMSELLHIDRAIRALELIEPYQPDFLIMPGDFVEGTGLQAMRCLKKFLMHVTDLPYPAIAIFGNHDIFSAEAQLIWPLDLFAKAKVPLLQNEMLDYGGLLFIGFEDGLHAEPRPELFGVNEAPRNAISLMHEPGVITRMPRHYSLQISGHTHGGQVCLPGGVSLFHPKLGGGYVGGYYPNAPIPLYVTRGIGTTGLPFRAFCRPEVTILDLDSA